MADSIVLYGSDNRPIEKMQYDQNGRPMVPVAPFEGPTIRMNRGKPVAGKRDMTDFMAALTAINPNLWPFDPGIPLQPITTGGGGIRWAPQAGYNLTYSPDKKIGIANSKLRLFADQCAGVRVVMEQLKREYVGLDKDIMPKDGEDDDLAGSPDHIRLQEWLRIPDGHTDLEQWEMALLEDTLVIGAPALWRMHDLGGRAIGMRPIDAALVTPIVTAQGVAPESPEAAYYYSAYGLPYVEYTEDELIYKPFNARTWTPYGFGPVESTISYVLLQIFRSMYYVNRYDKSDVPPGFITMPDTWSEKNIIAFANAFAERLTGEDSERHEVQFFPHGTTYNEVKQMPQWDYEFDEYLMRIFSWMVGVAPTPIIKQQSIGKGSEGLSEEALAAGLRPMQKFVKRIVDRYIADDETGITVDGDEFPRGLGIKGFEYNFVEEREENKQLKLQENTALQDGATKTINEVRADYGMDELDPDKYPAADVPMLKLATGWVPLNQVDVRSAEEVKAEEDAKAAAQVEAQAKQPVPGTQPPGGGGGTPGAPGGGGGTPGAPGGQGDVSGAQDAISSKAPEDGGDGGDGAAKVQKDFDEDLHPRDEGGRFSATGGGKGGTQQERLAALLPDARPEAIDKMARLGEANGVNMAIAIEPLVTFKHESGVGVENVRVSTMAHDQIEIRGDFVDKDGRTVGEFDRAFFPGDKEVVHNSLEIFPGAQDKGIGAAFVEQSLDSYDRAGLGSVITHANIDVGGYAWARMGFDFDRKGDLERIAGKAETAWRSRYGEPMPESMRGALHHSWDVAAVTGRDGYRIGKSAMLGSSWMGRLSLGKGEPSARVAREYFSSKKKPVAA